MKSIFVVLSIFTLMSGCYYDNIEELHPSLAPCVIPDTASFTNDVLPIMIHSCGSQDLACHNTDASTSGYGLGNFADVNNTIDNSGTFLKSITHDGSISASKWMPKGSGSKIDNCSIQKIQKWLNQGRLNN